MRRLDDKVAQNIDGQMVATEVTADDIRDIREQIDEAPIVKLVNSIIAQAADDGCSDIHFEPQAKELVIRFRNDGVLHEIMSMPRRMQSGVLSRLKIMADLDIAERRVPQDGRIGLMVGGKPIDMRVACLPTVYGEKIVIRLLDRSNVMLRLEDLGFSEKALARYRKSFTKPYGAILVTGPTGSGKSTTLYATLNILNSSEKNIITVEDPVEYRLAGINQVQTNPKAGLTFASGLQVHPAVRPRHRHDRRDPGQRDGPDRHRIGPHRPPGAVDPAHERRAGRALPPDRDGRRALPDRLGRRLRPRPAPGPQALRCTAGSRTSPRRRCSAATTSRPRLVDDWENVTLYKPVGCARCNGTGYKGRLGIYEVMLVTEAIERLTVERKSADEIGRVAQAEGMKSLREDGIDKVLAGQDEHRGDRPGHRMSRLRAGRSAVDTRPQMNRARSHGRERYARGCWRDSWT